MDIIFHPVFLEHETGDHPENKKRVEALGDLPHTDIPSDESPLTLFHTPQYIAQVRDFSAKGMALDPDTRTSPGSFKAAVAAVNATLMAADRQAFAVVRPPGHHAHPGRAEGFCIFNNVAIAAARLVKQGKRVFVFDFDGHLGDGTEEFFYDTDRVLYWSLHQKDGFPLKGDVDEIGAGRGEGYTINVPLPAHAGDDAYMQAVETLTPVAVQFNPDAVAVSAGFDAHGSDKLLQLNLSANTFYKLGVWLKKNFSNIFAVLEGGYNLETFPSCFYNFLDGINGKEQRYHEPSTESTIQILDQVTLDLDRLTADLSKFWKL